MKKVARCRSGAAGSHGAGRLRGRWGGGNTCGGVGGADDTGEELALIGEVVLRAVVEGDLPAFFEHQRDPESVRMAAFPAREREAFFEHWAKVRAEPGVIIRTIVFDGQVGGNIGSFERGGERLVGYWLGREFWGKGIATGALAAFLECDKTRPLYARVVPQNPGSIRVLEKCGFAAVGRDRAAAATGGPVMEEIVYRLG